jgi:predicted lipoprotein with Yx(FWY)xxD motif
MRRALPWLVALALVLAGCAQPTETALEETPAVDDPADETEEEPTEPDEVADDPADDDGAAVVAAADSEVGSILVDGEGLTLYLFDQDEGGQSTCYDDCASTWPPLLTEDEPEAGGGADETLLGTTQRDDGATQVTYGGHPLYYFAGDQAPGDSNGQGLGNVWWIVSPAGEAVGKADAPAGYGG